MARGKTTSDKSKQSTKKTTKKTAKKTPAKSAKKPAQGRKRRKKNLTFRQRHQSTINFILAVALFLAIVIVFSLIKMYLQQQETGDVVGMVNGDYIYESEVDNRRQALSPQMQQVYTDEMILDTIIQERLLLERIDALDITITDEEIDARLDEYLVVQGLEKSSLEQVLRLQGLTMKQLRRSIEKQLQAEKLLEIEAYDNVDVTEADAELYYNDNVVLFVVPEQVEIRHIFISTSEREEGEAEELANMVLLESQTVEFCELAEIYSDEEGCGAYNISLDSGLPADIIVAIFAMKDGSLSNVASEYGYHVLWRIKTHPESLMRFDSVKNEIKSLLLQQEQATAFRVYMATLRSEADIKNFLLESLVENITAQPLPSDFELQVMCISDHATLYGAEWDQISQKQLAVFGDAIKYLGYVECTEYDCSGIRAYPTWYINEEEHLGFQTLDRILDLTGCDE